MKKVISTALAVLAIAVSLQAQQTPPPPNFLNMVVLGDSLALGVKSGGVNDVDQQEAFPALIARQAGTFLFLPLLFGPTIELVEPGLPPVTRTIPATDVGRVFPLIVPQNLAVGGHNVIDGLTTRPDSNPDSLIDVILGVPLALLDPPILVSQVELAVGTQPTFTIFWLASNDVLGAALRADPTLITPFDEFTAAYQQAVGALVTLTPTQIIVANIPDVTTIAFLVKAEEVAAIAGAPLAAIGPALGIEAGDFVTLPGLPLITPILTGQQAGPLPDSVVFTAAEAEITRQATLQMNGFIDQFAGALGIPVVDAFGLIRGFDQNGVQVGNLTLTTDFLGGIFSLDGFHPTATGQGLIANAFIERINQHWGINLPLVDLEAIAAGDQLVIKPGAPTSMTLESFSKNGFREARKAVEMVAPFAASKDGESTDEETTKPLGKLRMRGRN